MGPLLLLLTTQTVVLEGTAEETNFFEVPFEVPASTQELQVSFEAIGGVLDFGLLSPSGFRGWSGDGDAPVLLNRDAASPSYLPGPIEAGTWSVLIGVPIEPYDYRVTVEMRNETTLAPQLERSPYDDRTLADRPGWYAGDLHVHSDESGDSEAARANIASFARMRGLDFVMLSDHNTVSQHQFLNAMVQADPQLLVMPGMEYTTYRGHANVIGPSPWIDPRLTIDDAVDAAPDAVFSINHPAMMLGDACRGCDWERAVPDGVGALEITTGGWSPFGYLFVPETIELWEKLEDQGRRLAIVGGSDDHRAGIDLEPHQSPIGSPTTMVYAESLSTRGVVEAIRAGRTVVKLQDPGDPMLTLDLTDDRLTATAEEAQGLTLLIYKNGERFESQPIDASPFSWELAVAPPESGSDRFHAEIAEGERPRTLTSHVYLEAASGCRCMKRRARPSPLLLLMGLAGLRLLRRRARK